MAWGTNSILDSLLAFDAQNIFDYGEDRLLNDFQRSLDAHNALVGDMVTTLVEDTTDRIRRYGIEARMEMIEADEYTRADAQKVPPQGVDIGFPLRPYQITLQWTRKAMEVMTPRDMATQMIAAQRADIVNVRRAVQKALYTPTNNLTYKDRFIDNITLPIRALLNADGAAIPEDDYGNTFDGSTHTHYLATASLTAANVTALLDTVIEHGVTGPMYLYINRAQEAAIRGFTGNFTPYLEGMIRPGPGSTAVEAVGGPVAPFDLYNRAIGIWNGNVEVWVKPWIYPSYPVAFQADPGRKPLTRRTRPGTAGRGDLRIVADDEKYPLRAETMEREFGIGVWNRDCAAVLYTGGGAYVAPTIT